MDIYLESLNKFKSVGFSPKERLLLKKIALYIKGEISTIRLIDNLSEKNIEFVVMVLNKVVNDAKRFNRYFIELPKDLEFNTTYPYALYSGDTYRFGLLHNTLKFTGPFSATDKKSKFQAKHFVELTGRFYYPHGASIIRNDWLKIISKYPYLDNYLYNISLNYKGKYSFEEIKKYIDSYFNKNINYYFENLLDENIDSIRFIEDKKYFETYNMMDGKVLSFKEAILSRQKR